MISCITKELKSNIVVQEKEYSFQNMLVNLFYNKQIDSCNRPPCTK